MLLRRIGPILTALALTGVGCRELHTVPDALYTCDSFTVCADSVVFPGGVSVFSVTDTLAITGISGKKTSIPPVTHDYPEFRSGAGVIDAMFNAIPDTSATLTSTGLFLSAPYSSPEKHLHALERSCNHDGYIITADSSMFRPIASGDPAWISAAWELYNITADQQFLSLMHRVAAKSFRLDYDIAYNRDASLMRGIPASLSDIPGSFPDAMGYIDRFETMCLRSNVEYSAALRALDDLNRLEDTDDHTYGLLADTIARAVNTRLWIPNLGYYSQAIYGGLCPIAAQATDNYGTALAVIHNVATPAMARSAISRGPLLADAVPALFPALDSDAYRFNPEVQAAWTIAAASAANDRAVTYGLAVMAARYLNEVAVSGKTAVHPVTASILYRGLLGMTFDTDGISFAPFIPSFMSADKTLTSYRYRNSVIDITVHGTGNIVSTFAIDGKALAEYRFPASLEGHHTVSITLAGCTETVSGTALQSETAYLPATPDITVENPRQLKVRKPVQGEKYMIWIDGALEQMTSSPVYDIYDARRPVSVALVPVTDNRWEGFAAPTYTYIPAGDIITIQATDIARPGSRIIKDKDIASRFVQSTRWKNRSLTFSVAAPADGDYLLRVSYLNGLGIVNPSRRCALRRVSVNGTDCGTLIFPQLPPKDWSHKADWRQLTAMTNMLPVTMRAGTNRVSIDHFDAPFPDFNNETNIILIDKIQIIDNNP